jgi:hypothetical protein
MHHRTVPDVLQPHQQSSYLSFAQPQLFGCLPLRDQLLLRLLQDHQPVPSALGHGQNS